jgi:hypothetical protein
MPGFIIDRIFRNDQNAVDVVGHDDPSVQREVREVPGNFFPATDHDTTEVEKMHLCFSDFAE